MLGGEYMDKYLEFMNVNKTFYGENGKTDVLKDISFSLHNDEIIAILGPSGCGKSTILNLISGLIKPTSGKIKINKEIGYMFQQDLLFSWRTVKDNVTLGLEISKSLSKENILYVENLLDKYHLGEFKNHYPNELSGGMQKRVSLIRTLALKPDVLLLDEPFSGLDYQTKLIVIEDIYKIIKNEKKSALIVTHDIGEAIAFASKVIILGKRPSYIKKIIDIDLKIDNKTPLLAYKSPLYSYYFDLIYKELEDERT